MDVQLQQLVYFLAVAETRHFTEAARRTFVAQPSLSKQIRALERELGAQLFTRARNHIDLTPAGETLLPIATRILADVETAKLEVQELAELRRGRLRLGATPSLSTMLVPPALAAFRARHPGIDLSLQEDGSRDLVRYLARGELDVALIIVPLQQHDPSLTTRPILREELVVAVHPGHGLAGRSRVGLRALVRHPLVMYREGYDLRSQVLGTVRAAGLVAEIAVEGGEMDAVLRMAAAGLGAAIVPSLVAWERTDLALVRLTPPLYRTAAVAHRRDVPLTRPARAFVAMLLDDLNEAATASRLPDGVRLTGDAPLASAAGIRS